MIRRKVHRALRGAGCPALACAAGWDGCQYRKASTLVLTRTRAFASRLRPCPRDPDCRARAIDGDTIVVGGIHVRLKGLDAPEIEHPGQPEPEPGGPEAAAFVHQLVDGRTAVCELTQERTHGRRVGFCSVGGQDVGEAVIRAGLVRACPRYSRRYVDLEQPAAAKLPQHGYCEPRRCR